MININTYEKFILIFEFYFGSCFQFCRQQLSKKFNILMSSRNCLLKWKLNSSTCIRMISSSQSPTSLKFHRNFFTLYLALRAQLFIKLSSKCNWIFLLLRKKNAYSIRSCNISCVHYSLVKKFISHVGSNVLVWNCLKLYQFELWIESSSFAIMCETFCSRLILLLMKVIENSIYEPEYIGFARQLMSLFWCGRKFDSMWNLHSLYF